MKIKFSMVVFGFLLVFGLFLSGCATLNNLFNPIHAVNVSGEKVEAVLGSGQTVKIGGIEYHFKNRPVVPSSPQEPVKPTKPNPPRWSSGPIDVEVQGVPIKDAFTSRDEAIRKIDFYTSQGNRNDLSYAAKAASLQMAVTMTDAFNFCERQQKSYESSLAQYQVDLPKYQQVLKQYEQDYATYQAKLPEYTTLVEAEVISIQSNIYAEASNNWNRYVEGQFLLYEGK